MPVLGVTPTNAPPRGKTPRSGGAPRSRQPPATSDSSPAPAAASRPSFSPRGSTADARSAAEATVRESKLCTSRPLNSALLVARAPPAPIQRACCQHWKCRVLQGIYPSVCPIWPPATGSSSVALYRDCRSFRSRLPAGSFALRLALQWRRSRTQEVVQ